MAVGRMAFAELTLSFSFYAIHIICIMLMHHAERPVTLAIFKLPNATVNLIQTFHCSSPAKHLYLCRLLTVAISKYSVVGH